MLRKSAAIAVALAFFGFTGHSLAQLAANGSFESNGGNGELGVNTSVTGWTDNNSGYNFVYAPGTADAVGAGGSFGNVALWGPANGVANGLTATSPDGGFYLALDGDFQQGSISQTINGLTAGDTYNVSFDWAASQQTGFFGDSTEQFQVGFGGQTLLTPVLAIASQGFSGWTPQTLSFTADASSDVLSFLAVGTPDGVPTFALLDGVNVSPSAAPLPSALSIGTAAMIGLAALRSYRGKRATA